MPSTSLIANPRHLEFEVLLFLIIVYEMDTIMIMVSSCVAQVLAETYILAASMTASRVVSSDSFNFSSSVFASCRPLPTAAPW